MCYTHLYIPVCMHTLAHTTHTGATVVKEKEVKWLTTVTILMEENSSSTPGSQATIHDVYIIDFALCIHVATCCKQPCQKVEVGLA